MDRIAVPDNQLVPIDQIAPNIRGLRIAFVNVFAVIHSNSLWTLIDAALPLTATRIRNWAETFSNTPPNAIVLTHGHFDHVSAARELADSWNAPIYAHRLESPYLTGKLKYPAPNVGAGGGAMSLLSPMYPRGPVDLGERLQMFDNDEIPELPGWRIIHTPGHTPGHVSFFRKSDKCLIAGDAFCTTKPESFFDAALTQAPELHGPPAYFTADWNAARGSVARLADLNPVIVAPGHGQPLRGPNLPQELHDLARRFDEVAIPDNRRPSAA
jgi:glyoxylase-like metal-dependent hydrolase (beta-lactamase superfamily II)